MTKLVLIKSTPFRLSTRTNLPRWAYCTQAFSDETRHNLVGLWSVAELGPIDDGIACLIPDLRQVDVSIIYRHQLTAVIVTDCICIRSSFVTVRHIHCSGSRPVSQETRVQRVPLCTGNARCMMKDGKISASPWPRAIRLPVPSP